MPRGADGPFRLTRRQVLGATATVAIGGAAAGALTSRGGHTPTGSIEPVGPGEVPITLRVNSETHTLAVEPRATLLDVLRERLGHTGTKKGCDRGECGACTVLADERRITSCSALAIMAQDREITTIEGLADGDKLHPLQDAFVRFDALQCGFCTPGQIMSAAGMLAQARAARAELSADQIREGMSGNLCRCGCYPNIVAAIHDVTRGVAG